MYITKHVWVQLFTVDTILNIGETGDMHARPFNPGILPDVAGGVMMPG